MLIKDISIIGYLECLNFHNFLFHTLESLHKIKYAICSYLLRFREKNILHNKRLNMQIG